jgi:hypothetical protein
MCPSWQDEEESVIAWAWPTYAANRARYEAGMADPGWAMADPGWVLASPASQSPSVTRTRWIGASRLIGAPGLSTAKPESTAKMGRMGLVRLVVTS